LAQLLVLIMAFIGVCMDLSNEKIANVAITIFIFIGLIYQTSMHGLLGIWEYLKGAGIPLLLLFILFIFRMLGPGDIKLLSALGGIMGVGAIMCCIIISFIFGAILSAAILISCGNLKERLRYLAEYITRTLQTKKITAYYKSGMPIENFHFSIPILMSIILYAGGIY
jgi:Flp pilus assembly protein, protease CpaA